MTHHQPGPIIHTAAAAAAVVGAAGAGASAPLSV